MKFIKTSLLTHQTQGISFILDIESQKSLFSQALWKMNRNPLFFWAKKVSEKKISYSKLSNISETPLGSILADHMGIGK